MTRRVHNPGSVNEITGRTGSEVQTRGPAAISPARVAAFEILNRVAAGKGHSDDLLHSHWTAQLSAEDRNLTTALVMGVLRWQIALDARIAALLTRPEQRLAEPVAIALRLGVFQLQHMDRIPAHAALNESVELCRAGGQPQAAGMVNAILRKVSRAPVSPASAKESLTDAAERLAHPAWLVERWANNYGRDAALAICEYDQYEPPVGGLFPAPSLEGLPHIDDGSRLVAELTAAAAAKVSGRKLRVWDTCAAPGGKTSLLAIRLPDAEILATDISARRMTQMQQRLRGTPDAEHIRCEVMDVAAAPPGADGFDLILCDAPCSGTGTLARNPEIRLALRAEDMERQAARQRAILSAAVARLAPGGRLVFSTCSLEPEENERVMEQILGTYSKGTTPSLLRVGVETLLASLVEATVLPRAAAERLLRTGVQDGALRTLPGTHLCDGFYAVVLERAR